MRKKPFLPDRADGGLEPVGEDLGGLDVVETMMGLPDSSTSGS